MAFPPGLLGQGNSRCSAGTRKSHQHGRKYHGIYPPQHAGRRRCDRSCCNEYGRSRVGAERTLSRSRRRDSRSSFAKYRLALAGVERLATDMRWCEGPVYFGDARCLLWSDIPNNRIMRWDEGSRRVSVYRAPSNNANGNTRDRQGRLATCETIRAASPAPSTTAPLPCSSTNSKASRSIHRTTSW